MLNPRPHKKLVVWQKAISMVTMLYDVSRNFPREEEFGLKSQMRRAAVSVPSNIAEGLTRKSKKDKLHFLNIANASLSEIDTQLEIAFRLRYVESLKFETSEESLMEVQRLLSGLIRSINP